MHWRFVVDVNDPLWWLLQVNNQAERGGHGLNLSCAGFALYVPICRYINNHFIICTILSIKVYVHVGDVHTVLTVNGQQLQFMLNIDLVILTTS